MIEDTIRKMLDDISTKKRRKYADMLRSLNLHIGQDQLLYYLWKEEGMTQNELSKHLNCEPPTIANMVRTLEKNGLIYRQQDSLDARVRRVYLTPKGKDLQEPIEVLWRKLQNQILNGMSKDELILLKSLIDKINNNLS